MNPTNARVTRRAVQLQRRVELRARFLRNAQAVLHILRSNHVNASLVDETANIYFEMLENITRQYQVIDNWAMHTATVDASDVQCTDITSSVQDDAGDSDAETVRINRAASPDSVSSEDSRSSPSSPSSSRSASPDIPPQPRVIPLERQHIHGYDLRVIPLEQRYIHEYDSE